MSKNEIKPQEGPQDSFLSTTADIAVYGGAAGGGKTFGLLLEPVRHVENGRFGCVIFRRTTKQISEQGMLWDASMDLYSEIEGARPVTSPTHRWTFPSGMKVTMTHLQHETDVLNWQGSEIPLIMFDELTHFTEYQFIYMLSRNRSTSGVAGYVRATCNPDVDSWVADWISWWIEQDEDHPNYGYAIPERSGVIRWFIRLNDEIVWGDSREELKELYDTEDEEVLPKSFTFIPSTLADNKVLMEKDPAYLANLHALPKVERERLLGGNWKIRVKAGDYFNRANFELIDEDELPANRRRIRYWDRASTEKKIKKKKKNKPDWTVGLLFSKGRDGTFYVEGLERLQGKPAKVENTIKNTASHDGRGTVVGLEQDPGSAGVFEIEYYVKLLAGFVTYVNKVSEDKETRAGPVSSQSEHGNIKVVRGKWNKGFFDELEAFPFGSNDDRVDTLSGAFNYFTSGVKAGQGAKAKREGKRLTQSHRSNNREY